MLGALALSTASIAGFLSKKAPLDDLSSPEWQGWEGLGGTLATDPVLIPLEHDRLAVFATTKEGRLFGQYFDGHLWKPTPCVVPSEGHWIGPIGGTRLGGRIELFARDQRTSHLLHLEANEDPSLSSEFVSWDDLGGDLAVGGPTVTVGPSGSSANVFARFADGSVRMTTCRGGHCDQAAWTNLGGATYFEPAAVAGKEPGRIDVFAVTNRHKVIHKFTVDNGKTWPRDWEDIGGSADATPMAVSWAPGRLDVVTVSEDSSLQYLAYRGDGPTGRQTCETDYCWKQISTARVLRDEDGYAARASVITRGYQSLDVFVQMEDHKVYRTSMASWRPSGDPQWTPLTSLANCMLPGGRAAVASRDNVSLDVALVGCDAQLWHDATSDGIAYAGAGADSPPAAL
jgi:hypothetical protein